MTRLNASATAALRSAGVPLVLWARANWFEDGKWSGDECGCPDDRCANGFHHAGADDCGCLPVLLNDFVTGGAHDFNPDALPPVRRPDGRFYVPMRLVVEELEEGALDSGGVLVFGTHDVPRAEALANAEIRRNWGEGWHAAKPVKGWWRQGMRDGERYWAPTEVYGRAAVRFSAEEDESGTGTGR